MNRIEGTSGIVRVLLAGMTKMLSNIVTAALAETPDVAVVGNVANDQELAAQIRATAADAVIVRTRRPGSAAPFMPLLLAFPLLKVVAVDANGRSGSLHELRLHSIHLAEMAADVLVSALRGALQAQ